MKEENKPAPTKNTEQSLLSAGSGDMAFLDHLEELRWRILRSLLAILVGAILCFAFSDSVMQLLTRPYEQAVLSLENQRSPGVAAAIQSLVNSWLGQAREETSPVADIVEIPPSRRLQALRPMTYFFISLQIAFMGGIVFALPYILLQIWKFVAPGLLQTEKRLAIPIISLSVLCFAIGALIAYLLVLPMGLRFFLALEPPDMTSQWAADEYIGFVLRLIFGFGIVFEMPVLALFLAKVGVLTADIMRRIRRYAIVAIFIVAAIVTPPDPVSQIMMALPLLLLYELSIWICKVVGKDRRRPADDLPEKTA
jgi:sec-independent protein translocase protein TatC